MLIFFFSLCLLFYFFLVVCAEDMVSLVVCLFPSVLLSFGLVEYFYDYIFWLISYNFYLHCFIGCFRIYSSHFNLS